MTISPVKPAGVHSAGPGGSTTNTCSSPSLTSEPKRQRRTESSSGSSSTPHAFRPPTAAELRVQGVGDLVEGTIALQLQQRGGNGQETQPPQQWSLHSMDGWRHRAFGSTAEGQEALRQQQREMRRALLRPSSAHTGPTAMVSSPVKGLGAAAGVVGAARRKGGRALSFGSGGMGEMIGDGGGGGSSGNQEAEEDSAWLPGHG